MISLDQICLSSIQANKEDVDSYNRAAVKEWTEVTLAQCGHCGRLGRRRGKAGKEEEENII